MVASHRGLMDHKNFLCVVVLVIFHFAESKYKAYNTTSKIVSGKLNVHLVPHSHDDVGWLKTLDQYYLGSKNTIQTACVQDVLDSIVTTLQIDKNRKFIYVEQAFFQMWWNDQSPAIHEMVKKLVSSGQLELINGGICMHDEATPHYIDMIDQTTLGHRFIKQEFNVTPRIGWQIDPFGHSAVQAYLLGAEVGFDALFFGRIDYQDRARRKDEKTLEVIWQGSKSLGSTAQIFAGAFPENYEPPADLSFEVNENTDHPIIQDNLNLSDYNVHERVDQFVSAAKDQAAITRTNHIMWTMGTDFKYQYAQTWFRQMDKFIHYVNRDGRVNALYSTPSIYTDAKYASKEAWPLKTDDYFPYADSPNSYWTGYFSSRPALKGYIRMMSAYYLAARQLEFLKGRSQAGPTTDALADALAIAQHHDAVSGTSKKHVADDYAKRLSIGYKEASEVVATSLACMVESSPIKSGCGSPTTKFQQCPLLNITYCPPSEVNVSASNSVVVLVYNPLGWKRIDIIRIPVMSDKVTVKDSSGKQIESQLLPLQNAPLALRKHYVEAYLGKSPKKTPKYWLAFLVSVPPLGFNTYTISGTEKPASSAMSNVLPLEKTHKSGKNTVDVGHGDLKLVYSTNEGKLISYVNSKTMVKESLTQSYAYYSAYGGYDQASGAYVFRPNASHANTIKPEDKPTILQGPLVAEVHEKINSWIYQITRVYKGKEHAEVEFIVGPVPTDDYVGKEAVTQITTDMKNNKTFYTDSNGRDFLERIRDHRKDWDLQVNEPVAGNYYPINLGMYMKDESKEFSILVDRSVGGSSIRDGQLELMLHRRLLNDDGKGVNEALDESVCIHDKCTGLTIVGRYYFRVDPLGKGAKWRRTFGQEIYSPLLLAFTEQDGDGWFNSHVSSSSMLDSSYVLPENVVIITLQELNDQAVLLRLAHLYEVGEDADFSDMASVHLHKLFAHRKISKIAEMSLSANQERTEMERKRLVWQVKGSTGGDGKVVRGKAVDRKTLVVELGPMEIRTFLINFAHKKSIPK